MAHPDAFTGNPLGLWRVHHLSGRGTFDIEWRCSKTALYPSPPWGCYSHHVSDPQYVSPLGEAVLAFDPIRTGFASDFVGCLVHTRFCVYSSPLTLARTAQSDFHKNILKDKLYTKTREDGRQSNFIFKRSKKVNEDQLEQCLIWGFSGDTGSSHWILEIFKRHRKQYLKYGEMNRISRSASIQFISFHLQASVLKLWRHKRYIICYPW